MGGSVGRLPDSSSQPFSTSEVTDGTNLQLQPRPRLPRARATNAGEKAEMDSAHTRSASRSRSAERATLLAARAEARGGHGYRARRETNLRARLFEEKETASSLASTSLARQL